MKRVTASLALSICATVLVGCATPAMQKMEKGQYEDLQAARADKTQLQNHPEAYFRELDEVWLGGDSPIRIAQGEAQPAALDAEVVFQRQYPITLQMLAEWIGAATGLKATVTADAVTSAAETAFDPLTQFTRSGAQAPRPAPAAGEGGGKAADGAFVIQYQGPLRGLLNEASARTGNDWVWRNGRIVILNTDTRVYQLHALPGTSTVTATVTNQSDAGSQGGGSSGGGGGGGGSSSGGGGQESGVSQVATSGQTTTMETTVETFDTVAKSIGAMLSTKGKVMAAAATGSITVTDVPAVLDRIETYIASLNAQLTRQVVIDVKVYSVDVTGAESYGIDWQTVWESVSGRYRVVTDLGGEVAREAGSISFGVIDPSYTYGGSQVLLRALSQQGNVSIRTSAAVATLSNQPVPVQVAEETSYLAQAQSNLVANAGSSTTLTAGKVVTGFSMNLIPVVLTGNDILLQMQINLSNLRGIREIVSAGTRIEVPNVNARQFLQRVKLASGATLVLGGFEQDQTETSAQGIGDAKFTLLGGSRNGTQKRTVMVITLTPRVVG